MNWAGMETRSAKRKKLLDVNTEDKPPNGLNQIQDRISDLPNDILHHILLFLPIKSIAKTGILSRRWRDIWYSFPNLDFTTAYSVANATTVPSVRSSKMRRRERSCFLKESKYIDQILGLLEKHSGIKVLKFRFFLSFSRLNGLIRRAVRHDVQELDVEVSTFDYFNFPRSVINCDTLRVFRLKSLHPGFRLPPVEIMNHGFKSLCILSLSHPILHNQPSVLDLFTDSSFPSLKNLNLEACLGLKNLRIKCPALEDLSIDSCYQMQDLEISVPKLQRLRVSRCFTCLTNTRVKIDAPMLQRILWCDNPVTEESVLQNIISLHEARVGFYIPQDYQSPAKIRSAFNFLSGISQCQHSLTLESQCIEIVSRNSRLAGVSLSLFKKLRSLELFSGFNKHNNPGLAKIFKNSPATDTVIIKICGYRDPEQRRWKKDLWEMWSPGEETEYWESQLQHLKSFVHHLKVVKIHGFAECANDISFVKFILKHGKLLQQMFLRNTLSFKQIDSLLRQNIRSQIMGFSRASSDADIIFQ